MTESEFMDIKGGDLLIRQDDDGDVSYMLVEHAYNDGGIMMRVLYSETLRIGVAWPTGRHNHWLYHYLVPPQ